MNPMEEHGDKSERRVFRRAEVARLLQLEILIGSDDSEPPPVTGETVNIGCGGISARIRRPITPGTMCRVRIGDPDETAELDDIKGVVRWCETPVGGAYVGIEFDSPLTSMRRPASAAGSEAVPASSPARVLVADDEPQIRSLLVRFLSDLGCEVDTAADGEEALEAMRRQRPDILLLDLRMPRLDGLGVLEQIRRENLDVGPIWAVSGYASDEDAEQAMHLGASDFINKPLDLQYLEWSLCMCQMAAEDPAAPL